jgi:hypothetical protein
MLNAIMSFLGYSLLVLYCVSWTNFLHDKYNMWGFIVWVGTTFNQ